MDFAQAFCKQLQSSSDSFIWAIQQVPSERLYAISPKRPESWSPARVLFHLMYYDEQVVLSNMRLWLSSPLKLEDGARIERYHDYSNLEHDEEEAWSDEQDIDTMLTRFRASRDRQMALLPQFLPTAWEETRPAVWGTVTLRWMLTKTIHHTTQHTHDILLRALFWNGAPSQL